MFTKSTSKISFLISFFLFLQLSLNGQTTQVVFKLLDDSSLEPLIGATLKIADQGYVSDLEGKVVLDLPFGEYLVQASYVGYQIIQESFDLSQEKIEFTLKLKSSTILETATITGSKFETSIGESTISIDVIKPDLIRSTNAPTLEEVLDKVSGVQMIDGQVNIRGGSGFSYGAGSRVLLLIDNMPALQADAGLPNWDDIPIENVAQVEVIKGAASTLYGASALNGIIHMRTGYAGSTPETDVSISYRKYMAPKDELKHWWKNEDAPFSTHFNILHKQKFGKLDLVASANLFNFESWNQETYNKRSRLTFKTRYRFTDRLSAGVNLNFNDAESADFFFWHNGASGATRPYQDNVSSRTNIRYFIDPFISYFDQYSNSHRLNMRYHYINNDNNMNQANESNNMYAEYQFQREFDQQDLVTTSGIVWNRNSSDSELFADTIITALNVASYLQADKKFFDRLNVSAGIRYEYNKQNVPEEFMGEIIPNGEISESNFIARFGANLKVSEGTFLRGSWGQGYRYPTITERLIATNFNGSNIFPNINLESEKGWSAELAIKQGFSLIGLNGYLDIAAFWSEYDNMMEFTFATIDGASGYQSQNIGGAIIKGLEISLAGQSKIFSLPLNWIGGYTYIDPKYKDFNSQLQESSSYWIDLDIPGNIAGVQDANEPSENFLKYRSKHNFKMDVETGYQGFRAGVSVRQTSHMLAIDRQLGLFAQISQYREFNNQGYRVWDARISYERYGAKLSFLLNNFLNEEYTVRPGLLEAPRNYAVRLDYKF